MKFDELFEQRNLVAAKLKDCIRDAGYTKISFAGKVDISRPTLDRLLNGSIENKNTFDKHLQKILAALEMTVDDLMFYHSEKSEPVAAVYSKNMPAGHEMNPNAKRQMELLMDVVDLCAIYY